MPELKRPKKTIVFEVEEEMKAWLEQEAKKRGNSSVSSLIRLALDMFRQTEEHKDCPQGC